jgi:hypothetical protein
LENWRDDEWSNLVLATVLPATGWSDGVSPAVRWFLQGVLGAPLPQALMIAPVFVFAFILILRDLFRTLFGLRGPLVALMHTDEAGHNNALYNYSHADPNVSSQRAGPRLVTAAAAYIIRVENVPIGFPRCLSGSGCSMKGIGYLISSLSLLLLGFVTWKRNQRVWKSAASIVGMVATIVGS